MCVINMLDVLINDVVDFGVVMMLVKLWGMMGVEIWVWDGNWL